MPARDKPPPTIVEVEFDPRDVEDILCGRRRKRPRPPVSVTHHTITPAAQEQFLRRIGAWPPPQKE